MCADDLLFYQSIHLHIFHFPVLESAASEHANAPDHPVTGCFRKSKGLVPDTLFSYTDNHNNTSQIF
jgi:hypothetical protein